MSFISRRRGWRNISSYWPEGCSETHKTTKPDLGDVICCQLGRQAAESDQGPKVYIASEDVTASGSTPLHVDMACAVNIMAYTASSQDGTAGGARWLLWRQEHVPTLEAVLRERFPHVEQTPSHYGNIFVDSALEKELAARGAPPLAHIQRAGEAIFIPAGVPHQVRTDLSVPLSLITVVYRFLT